MKEEEWAKEGGRKRVTQKAALLSAQVGSPSLVLTVETLAVLHRETEQMTPSKEHFPADQITPGRVHCVWPFLDFINVEHD